MELHLNVLLTIQEVAFRLRVDTSTVLRWIKRGELEAIKLPGRGKRHVYRVTQDVLHAALQPMHA